MSKYCTDSKERDAIYRDFNAALLIVFHNNQFYILTETSFIVYGGCHSYFEKVYEEKLKCAITCADDLEDVMQDYMNSCKGKWVGHNNDNYGNKDKDYGYGNKDNKDKDYGYGNKDKKDNDYGYGNKDHKDNGYGNKDYKDKDYGYGNKDNGYGNKDNGYGNKDNGYGSNDKKNLKHWSAQ